MAPATIMSEVLGAPLQFFAVDSQKALASDVAHIEDFAVFLAAFSKVTKDVQEKLQMTESVQKTLLEKGRALLASARNELLSPKLGSIVKALRSKVCMPSLTGFLPDGSAQSVADIFAGINKEDVDLTSVPASVEEVPIVYPMWVQLSIKI